MRKSTLLFVLTLFLATSKAYTISPPLLLPVNYNLNQDIVKLFYSNGEFQIDGLTGIGSIQIYSIIGNEVLRFNSESLDEFKKSIPLEPGNMYIVRIITETNVKTYKIIAN
tara:strand:- start:1330 stop:1662 length:333 start_codon:yes stop_codon:yes gene_type:complete